VRVTEDHIFVTSVPLLELGIPGGSGSAVPATFVAVYYKRIGGYTERTAFVADVEVVQGEQGLYLKCPERGEWRCIFAHEVPQTQIMITFDPDDVRIWRSLPKWDQKVSPIAVYVLL